MGPVGRKGDIGARGKKGDKGDTGGVGQQGPIGIQKQNQKKVVGGNFPAGPDYVTDYMG